LFTVYCFPLTTNNLISEIIHAW